MSIDYVCPLCESEIPSIRFIFPICDNCGVDIRGESLNGAGRVEARAKIWIGSYVVEGTTQRVAIRKIDRLFNPLVAEIQISIKYFRNVPEPTLEKFININDWSRFQRLVVML